MPARARHGHRGDLQFVPPRAVSRAGAAESRREAAALPRASLGHARPQPSPADYLNGWTRASGKCSGDGQGWPKAQRWRVARRLTRVNTQKANRENFCRGCRISPTPTAVVAGSACACRTRANAAQSVIHSREDFIKGSIEVQTRLATAVAVSPVGPKPASS